MRKSMLLLALVPAVALAQGAANKGDAKPGPGGGPGDEPARFERMQKRMKLAATLGLAEALDLDDQATLRVRDVIGRDADRRIPLMRQMRESVRTIRDAARGDRAAAGQVDAAIQKMRDTRAQMQKLDDETFAQITNGLSPEKKARAALFLARFRERGRHMPMRGGPGWGPGAGPFHGPPGEGAGPGMLRGRGAGFGSPGGRGPGGGLRSGDAASATPRADAPDEPDLEDWLAGE
jgi:Spy/CpxP family protein refolding chaperone